MIRELEAESVAHVVCSAPDIDYGEHSFCHVAGWAGHGKATLKEISSSAHRIQHAARSIPDALEPMVELATEGG